jgi:hypothetical protein
MFEMSDEGLPFQGDWEELILAAIIEKNILDWEGLRKETSLSPKQLNMALSELLNSGIIIKRSDSSYWVKREFYRQYKLRDLSESNIGEVIVTSEIISEGFNNLLETFTENQSSIAESYNMPENIRRLVDSSERLVEQNQKQNQLLEERNKQHNKEIQETRNDAKRDRYIAIVAIIIGGIIGLLGILF